MNRNILDHIKNNHQHQSRYDIDRHLLQQGHDPAEIDYAWQQVQAQANKRPPKLFNIKRLWSWPVRLSLVAACLIYYSLSQPVYPNYSSPGMLPPTPTLRPATTPIGLSAMDYSSDTSIAKEDYTAKSIWASSDGGLNWSQVYSGTNLQMLVCADPATCYAFDGTQFLSSTDGGKNWNVVGQLDSSNWFGLNCPAVQHCYSLQQDDSNYFIRATSDGGKHWAQVYRMPKQGLSSKCNGPAPCQTIFEQIRPELRNMACPTITTCYVTTESNLLTTSDSGQTWQYISMPISGDKLSCPTARDCFVLNARGSSVAITADGGQTWFGNRPPHWDYVRQNTNIVCPTPSTCYASIKAVGGSYYFSGTKDGGHSWQQLMQWPRQDDVEKSVTNLSCPDETHCLFSDQTGHLLTTNNGWEKWQGHQLNQPAFSRELTCPTIQVCFRLTK